MDKKLISIIIAAYNAQETIVKCLDSILKQTYQNFEILVVDDGSQDNTFSIISDYAENDSRIRCFCKENGGQSSARNMAMEYIQGELFTFVDSDDYIMPEMLERLYSCMVQNHVDISMCGMVYKTEKKTRNLYCYKDCLVTNTKQIIEDFLKGKFIYGPSCKLYDSKFKKISFIDGIIFEDIEYLSRVYLECNSVACTDYAGYVYLVHNTSTTHSNFSEKKLDLLKVSEIVAKRIRSSKFTCEKELTAWLLNCYITMLFMLEEATKIEKYEEIKKLLIQWIRENLKVIVGYDIITIKDKLYAIAFSSECDILIKFIICVRKRRI